MGNIGLFASVEFETSVNNVLERVIPATNWTQCIVIIYKWDPVYGYYKISTNLVIVGLGFVHHPADSVFNDGFPNNSPLGDRDPIPELLFVRICSF